MGRDVTGLRIGKKPNFVNLKSNVSVHVAPKDLPDSAETNHEPEDHISQGRLLDTNEKHDERGLKSISHMTQEKIVKAEANALANEELNSPTKPAPGSALNGENSANLFEAPAPGLEGETSDSGAKCSSKSNDLHSPKIAKKSQVNFLFMSRKQQPKYYEDDDNWSLASSTATSRTIKSRVTVPVAPSFVCTNRAERRREFYAKLEVKHKALEQEKVEYEARNKEEEQAAVKQLRKSMTYRANPVPSFYSEGPPPKVELKKLPVTRAKSPNLTRRKSRGDAAKTSPVDKGLYGQTTRHSVGMYKEHINSQITASPKSSDRNATHKSNGTGKMKDQPRKLKETLEISHVNELGSADITIAS